MILESELERHFGFNSFRNGQKEVISRILDGESVTAIFPTGAGKSICYQLPALLLPGLTVVVSPLISLMHDQLDFLIKKGIKAASLDSTLTREEYQKTVNMAVTGELKVLMISVERFKNERFRSYLNKMTISLLVVDEAHCISEWGHNFRPEYLKLPNYIKEFKIPQVLLLTATATVNVANDMCKKLGISGENCIRTGFYRKNLFLKVTPVSLEDKNDLIAERINNNPDKPTIIYVTLQKTAEDLALFLRNKGLDAAPYHAGLKNDERGSIQSRFMEGEINCVVATIAFGMGIDKSDIRRVIHYDLPKSIENYSQEIGRAGRDGKDSECEIFANREVVNLLENFIYGDTPAKDSIKMVLKDIYRDDREWEVKILSLSKDVNIRQLPLKTLLVYLEIEGIITSKYTYFAEYQFKTDLKGTEILSRFKGERRDFLASLFRFVKKKRLWLDVNIDDFVAQTGAERSRVVSALEYLDSQNLIELSAKQGVEVYKIENKEKGIDELSEKLYSLFKNKEDQEIVRIKNMISFFESETCLSANLASYYGENIEEYSCGHCSVCSGDVAVMRSSESLPVLTQELIHRNIKEFLYKAGSDIGREDVTRFLCGITSPLLTKLRAKSINGYASLEKYPYKDVFNSVPIQLNK